jgi:dihydroorotate dehydrogenase (fumarate)
MNLKTRYLGIELKNPIVPSASPLTADLDSARRLEDAGAAAIVMPSLFEEQILADARELDHHLTHGTDSFAEALSYFPDQEEYRLGPEGYLENLRRIKEAVDVPVFGSLNGVSEGGWTRFAKKMEEAGADGIELNLYFIPTDPSLSGRAVEQLYVDTLKSVKATVSVPIAMKLSPFFSSMSEMAQRLDEAGADGLVLFNRFYQPDLDLENLEVRPNILLSTPQAMRLPLRWVAILHGRIKASLAATSGILSGEDALRMLMAGADVTMVASLIFQRGPTAIKGLLAEIEAWMEEKEYESVEQLKGSMSQKSVAEPAAYERALYVQALQTYRS